MRKKSIVMALILIIASAGVGTGFSLAVGTFRTNGILNYSYDVNFTFISITDNEIEKNVAIESAEIVTTNFSQVIITNAYPGYIAYVDFTMKNTGRDPVFLNILDIGPYDTDALDVQLLGVNQGIMFFPGLTIDGQLTIEVKQDAVMNSNYPFLVNISFVGSPQP